MKYISRVLILSIITVAQTCSKSSKSPLNNSGDIVENNKEQDNLELLAEKDEVEYRKVRDFSAPTVNHLTCMLDLSQEKGQVILRLRTSVGGLVTLHAADGSINQEVYLPAAVEVLIYTRETRGTFTSRINGTTNTKACSSE